ncbi:hypothetical protein [Pseudomonas sp.]|uniref:hypothetical protein n=1 Tax=Pseudomonas sp. TaxID=306 RepID=UPI003FD8571C
MSDVAVVGSSSNSKYIAYGDDSQYNGALVYAFLIFRRTKLKSIVREVEDIKRRFKFPVGAGIHCRELMSGQLREKKGLSHLTETDINSILANVITVINRYQGLVRFTYAFMRKLEGMFPEDKIVLQSIKGDPDITLSAKLDPKGILGHLALGCFMNGNDHRQGPSPADCQIFVSPDPTVIKFIGDTRTQAHFLASGFINDFSGSDGFNSVVPIIGGGDYPQLLDVADVLAYVCCHAIHADSSQKRFNKLYDLIEWRVGSEYIMDPPL